MGSCSIQVFGGCAGAGKVTVRRFGLDLHKHVNYSDFV